MAAHRRSILSTSWVDLRPFFFGVKQNNYPQHAYVRKQQWCKERRAADEAFDHNLTLAGQITLNMKQGSNHADQYEQDHSHIEVVPALQAHRIVKSTT